MWRPVGLQPETQEVVYINCTSLRLIPEINISAISPKRGQRHPGRNTHCAFNSHLTLNFPFDFCVNLTLIRYSTLTKDTERCSK